MSTLKSRVPGNIAISLVAASITPAFYYLLNETAPFGLVFRMFLVSAVFAGAITFLADGTLHWLEPHVQRFRESTRWVILVVALVLIATVGCIAATGLLIGVNAVFHIEIFTWSESWREFVITLKLCVFITVVFGIVIAVYERLRGRLSEAELKLRTQELERERAITFATEARLAALQARIHPHFLFNTLNSISSLIPHHPEKAERLIERMAALLRFSLEMQRGGLVPFAQELKIVTDYLEIEKARLGQRLRYEIEASDALAEISVPPLSVQTLVENSIKYAIAPNRDGGNIRVQAAQNNGSLVVQISDTGSGFTLESAPPGHGLDNLRGRLSALYGQTAELSLSRSDGWTTVRLKVPA